MRVSCFVILIWAFFQTPQASPVEHPESTMEKVRPRAYTYIFSYSRYYGYHRNVETDDNSWKGECISYLYGGLFLRNSRWGFGLGLGKDLTYAGSSILVQPSVSISYILAYGRRSFHILTLDTSVELDYWTLSVIGYSFMFDYSYVVRPPWPVEAKIRFGRIDKIPHGMGRQSGIQFAAGIQVGLGWWWTERTSEP